MKRYTVTFVSEKNLSDAAKFQKEFAQVLTRGTVTSFQIIQIMPVSPTRAEVAMLSDMPAKRFTQILESAASTLGVNLEAVEWGWSDEVVIPSGALFVDRYADIPGQVDPEGQYTFGNAPLFALSVLVWLGITAWLTVVNAPSLVVIALSGYFFIMLIAIGLATTPRMARFTANGIEIRYWVLPDRKVGWDKVCSFRIEAPRMIPYGIIRKCGLSAYLPIIFRIGSFTNTDGAAPTEIDLLVKTIISRASLRFVEGSPWGSATYRCAKISL